MQDASEKNSPSARDYVWDKYDFCLTGDNEALFAVLCDSQLAPAAFDALAKTAPALGWQAGATFASVDSGQELDADQVFELVEGLDPIALVVAGKKAAALAAEAYHCELPTQGHLRLFGRSACVFEDLGALLAKGNGRQKAWEILKTLPSA